MSRRRAIDGRSAVVQSGMRAARPAIMLWVLASVVGLPRSAEACLCDGRGRACEAAWKVPAVFTARVLAVVDQEKAPRRVEIRVLESFRGSTAGHAVIFTGYSQGDCGIPFKVGEDYLIYASPNVETGRLHATTCTPTRRLADAREDLNYLRGLSFSSAASARLFGRVERLQREGDGLGSRIPLDGISVTARGEGQSFSTRTARDGSFEMKVPVGEYRMEADLPENLYLSYAPQPVIRDVRGCAEVPMQVLWNGRISGRVVDARGAPVPFFRVDLATLERDPARMPSIWQHTLTDAAGQFELSRVSPGEFAVAFDQIRKEYFWLPVPLLSAEQTPWTARIKPGARVAAGNLIVPAPTPLMEVSGVVLGPTGEPYARATVLIRRDTDDGSSTWTSVATDAGGHFRATVIGGRRYRVSAEAIEGRVVFAMEEPRLLEPAAAATGLVLRLRSR